MNSLRDEANGVGRMRYVITATRQTDRRTTSSSSAHDAVTILDLLAEAGFQVEHVMDEQGQRVTVEDVKRAAKLERPTGSTA